MQHKIKTLKYRIDKNYSKLISIYGDKCELAMPIINMIDILIQTNASDAIIIKYLEGIEGSLLIIEEKLQHVESIQ